MPEISFPTDDVDPPIRPNAPGEAALLLVESLIHGLIGKSILSAAEAVEIIEVAAEIRSEMAAERGESGRAWERSQLLLTAMSSSLRHDAVT